MNADTLLLRIALLAGLISKPGDVTCALLLVALAIVALVDSRRRTPPSPSA